MRKLTPNFGPHFSGIASRGRSVPRRPDARAHTGLTREVDHVRRQLEHLTGLPNRVDHLVELPATRTVTAFGARYWSDPGPSWRVMRLDELTLLPQTTHASRR